MARTHSTKVPGSASEAVVGLNLSGKVFVITGGYSGLGAATSKALASAGATVVIAGRNANSQTEFSERLMSSLPGIRLSTDACLTVDLSDLASVATFARNLKSRYDRIDCLINNAGVMNTPPGTTREGFEIQFGTNVIGHHLLARVLADRTKRQVWLSSAGHTLIGDPPGNHDLVKAPRIDIDAIRSIDPQNYDSWRRYQQSKLAAILLAKQFAKNHTHLKTCAVHPGVVRTNLSRHMSPWLMVRYLVSGLLGRSQKIVGPDEGARTQTLCAVMPDADLQNGAYYADCAPTQPAAAAEYAQDAKRLYDYCEEVTSAFHSGT